MHAFLVTGSSIEKRLLKAEELLSNMDLKEINRVSPENSKHLIAGVRNLNSTLRISPLDREKGRGIILEEANLLTQDAANAFLKTLEEPPPGNYLVLTAPTRESVLETIASRCTIIDLGTPDLDLSKEDLELARENFEKITISSVGEKFNFVDGVKDRDQARAFVIGQIYIVRERLHTVVADFSLRPSALDLAALLDSLEKTRVYLEANVNVKLALSELVLKYPEKFDA